MSDTDPHHGSDAAQMADGSWGWPAGPEAVVPYLSAVIGVVGCAEGVVWLEAARRAQTRHLAQFATGSSQLEFSELLEQEMGEFDATLPRLVAWEALNAVHREGARHGIDLDVLLQRTARDAANAARQTSSAPTACS